MIGLTATGISWAAQGRHIVDDVSLVAPAGQVTGLLGPNGAGKSSLIKVLAGINPPTNGSVQLTFNNNETSREAPPSPWSGATPSGSVDFLALPRRDRARLLAVVEQSANTDLPLSVTDAVLLGCIPHRSLLSSETEHDREIAAEALARTGAAHLATRNFSTLSGGERQRVHLARALAQQPEILILDEPTNHLDIASQLDTLALLRELADQGLTIIAALHDLNLAASTCDHLVLLSHGRVAAAGTPTTVLTPAVIDPVYGVRTAVLADPTSATPILTFRRRAEKAD